jgi:glycine/D-amino acid oxidase-like deaminating enzyme
MTKSLACQLQPREIVAGMVRPAGERAGGDHQEAFDIGDRFVGLELFRRDEAHHLMVLAGRLQVLADSHEVDDAKIVTSRLGRDRFRVAGTADINGLNFDIRADRIEPLVRWTRRHFPGIDTSRLVPWSGLRPMMPNMLPRVGQRRHPYVFYNTGHGHLGWTLSCATAEIIGARIAESFAT